MALKFFDRFPYKPQTGGGGDTYIYYNDPTEVVDLEDDEYEIVNLEDDKYEIVEADE